MCRIGDWKLRALHELGHFVGFKHNQEKYHVMHPWGIYRGRKGNFDIIDCVESTIPNELLHELGILD